MQNLDIVRTVGSYVIQRAIHATLATEIEGSFNGKIPSGSVGGDVRGNYFIADSVLRLDLSLLTEPSPTHLACHKSTRFSTNHKCPNVTKLSMTIWRSAIF